MNVVLWIDYLEMEEVDRRWLYYCFLLWFEFNGYWFMIFWLMDLLVLLWIGLCFEKLIK